MSGASLTARGARALCAAVAVLALALVHAAQDGNGKRAESEFLSPMPFVLGSRYGRSQPRLISPRNDRFFMSSRYGKRSEPPAPHLVCTPTPVRTLYRCTPAPASRATAPTTHYQRNNGRSEEEREIGEDE